MSHPCRPSLNCPETSSPEPRCPIFQPCCLSSIRNITSLDMRGLTNSADKMIGRTARPRFVSPWRMRNGTANRFAHISWQQFPRPHNRKLRSTVVIAGRFQRWREAFLNVVQEPVAAAPLKAASLAEDLKAWTACRTSAVVASCGQLGWPAAAKRHRLSELPKIGQEYPGIDVMAFPGATDGGRWRLPIAAFELENHRTDDRVAYSHWGYFQFWLLDPNQRRFEKVSPEIRIPKT